MSKIIIFPSNIETGLPLQEGELRAPEHPSIKNASVFYCSIERYLDYNEASVGDTFCYFTAQEYDHAFHDPNLPYGTHCITGEYELRFGGHIVVTQIGWEWIRGKDGEISK